MKRLLQTLALSSAAIGLFIGPVPANAQVNAGINIQIGPPTPIVETLPARPGPGYIWRGGYWSWNGGRYSWVHGYYAQPPNGRTVWVPGHWRHAPNGWVWREGHWT
jgi:hypothetical protein